MVAQVRMVIMETASIPFFIHSSVQCHCTDTALHIQVKTDKDACLN